MGYQMTALMQKREGDKWINIDILPRDEYEPDIVETCYCRNDVHWQRHWDWLGMEDSTSIEIFGEEIPPYLKPNGLPDDIVEGSFEWDVHEGERHVSWRLIEDLLAINWDEYHMFYNGEPMQSLRSYLGQPFIDWLQSLKDKGVERIVYSFG